ncbi:MAG: hypothetical protein ACP5MZ_01145 [Candidatus Micrarchaeia archaeon]
MFTLYYLLIAFAVLGFMDIAGNNKINIKYLLGFSAISIMLSILFRYYVVYLSGYYIYIVAASVIILYLLPRLGLGDKIFISSLLILYPFWLVWVLIALAALLAKPVFAFILLFSKKNKIELPFYPLLFISSAILLIVFNLIYYI